MVVARDWLYLHQVKWLADKSRFRIANKARQIGFSLAIALEAMVKARFLGEDSLLVSASEKNAHEVLSKCAHWVRWFREQGDKIAVNSDSKSELSFLNGGKILSLAQNPDTVRGFTGNVYLDEFAHHSNDKEIYEAILPVASLGYQVSILSTPMGESGKFYDIWTDQYRFPDYSRHEVDVNRAVGGGLVIDIEAIRRNLDEDSFAQEYLCQFIDESTAFIPYDAIRGCISDQPDLSVGKHFLGIDVARRRHLTVLMVLTEIEDKLHVKRIERMRNQTFASQRAMVRHLIAEEGISRGAIDATGLGMQFSEELNREYHFMEPVVFTSESKERMAHLMKRAFDNREVSIPADNDLISAIHSIRKTVTPSNNIRFDAEADSKGHADEFWAMALALDCAKAKQMTVRQY